MITAGDIAKLAELSRVEVDPAEAARLAKDIDSILGFVSRLRGVADSAPEDLDFGFAPADTLRADEGAEAAGENREALLAEAPKARDGFVEVQKVLGGRGGEA